MKSTRLVSSSSAREVTADLDCLVQFLVARTTLLLLCVSRPTRLVRSGPVPSRPSPNQIPDPRYFTTCVFRPPPPPPRPPPLPRMRETPPVKRRFGCQRNSGALKEYHLHRERSAGVRDENIKYTDSVSALEGRCSMSQAPTCIWTRTARRRHSSAAVSF